MQQYTSTWWAARKGRITGSAVGAILGLSPFMTRDDVLRRMVREFHGADAEFVGNVATEYGTFHEAGARVEYEMETGRKVIECGFFTEGDWLGASPDGLVNDDGLIEIKCPYGQRDKNPPEFKSINDQLHYYMQIQIQLYCSRREWCDFFQWSQHGTMLERVYINETVLDQCLPSLKEFHELYLREINNKKHLEPKRQHIDTPHIAMLLAEYDELGETIDHAQARKKDVLNELVKISNESNSELCDGRLLTKVDKQGSISYAKALKEIAPDADLEKWRGSPTSFWKLT